MSRILTSRDALERDAVKHLSAYIKSGRARTDHLKDAAHAIAELRAHFTLDDGRVDWGGRSPAYRAAIHEVYSKARVSRDDLDTVQSALRYHVGNRLRETVDADELAASGLAPASPKARKAKAREIVAALSTAGSVGAITGDPVRLVVYADVLLDAVVDEALRAVTRREKIAARHALHSIAERLPALLALVNGKAPAA